MRKPGPKPATVAERQRKANGQFAIQKSDWTEGFLAAYGENGNIRASCRAVDIGRREVDFLRDNDPEFAAAFEIAREDSIEHLEHIGRKRAEASSDVLLIFLLKSLRPEVYRETIRNEFTGKDGKPIQHEVVTLDLTSEGLARAWIILRDAGAFRLGTGSNQPEMESLDNPQP